MKSNYRTNHKTGSGKHAQARGEAVPFLYRKSSGQAMVIIVLSVLVLIAIVGLAIDGGSNYDQRRKAQNAADASALAGTRMMLTMYEDMIMQYSEDVNWPGSEEDKIRDEINRIATANGIDVAANPVTAYFVNDQKQVVTVSTGEEGCGLTNPCQVGKNGKIPWAGGAKGIYVTVRSETDTFLMSAIGFNKVSATASTTAFMGVATNETSSVGLLPIAFFTNTNELNNLTIGRDYTLISGSTKRGPGLWGYIDFNGGGQVGSGGGGNGTAVTRAWIECGFSPYITTGALWSERCPQHSNNPGLGPLAYWEGQEDSLVGPKYTYDEIKWPTAANEWWWLQGSTGSVNSACQFFEGIADLIQDKEFLIPIFDSMVGDAHGNNAKFHLIGLARFQITSTSIRCKKNDQGNYGTPVPEDEDHWIITGKYISRYAAGSTGTHGDLRRSSNHLLFLEP